MMKSESSLATFARELTTNMFRREFFNQPLRLVKEITLGRGKTSGSATGLFNSLSPFLVDARYLLTCFVSDTELQQTTLEILPGSNTDSEVRFIKDSNPEQLDNMGMMVQPMHEVENKEPDILIEDATGKEGEPGLIILPESEDTLESNKILKDGGGKKNKKNKKKKKKNESDFDLPLSSFSQWLLTHKQLTKKGDWILPRKKKKKKMHESARKSITPSDEIISESLAMVLKKQGHFLEAKKMYQKLILKWPEHTARYESEINEINENL